MPSLFILCVTWRIVICAAVVRHMRRRVKGRKFATAFVSELVDVLAVPENKFPSIRYNPPSASLPAGSPSSTLLHPLYLPLPPSAPPTHVSSLQPHHPPVSRFLVCSSRVPVLDQGSNITPNQSKNITHVSKLCRFFFFLQQPFASPFSPNFPLLPSSPSIQ